MIPTFFKTGLIRRLVLFLCLLGSACVDAAPILISTEIQDSFYQWLDQQPPQIVGYSLTITPSGSFASVGSQLFYTPGIDLNEKFKDSAWAAGFEVTHTLLLSLILKMALWINPAVPVYLPVSFSVDWYRFLRLWKSRLLLVWQLVNWGKGALSETIWPEKQRISLNLSSPETGVVIGELDIPVDTSKPIELNIYNDGESDNFKGCDNLATFDCVINSLRAMGVHRWKLQWMHDSYEANQWFYPAEEEPLPVQLTLQVGVGSRGSGSEGSAHFIGGILSALLSEELLNSVLDEFHPVSPHVQDESVENWFGESSAFIPLGCQPETNCPGLYVAEGMTTGDAFVKRMVMASDVIPSELLASFDDPGNGIALSRSSQLYRIPESVITVTFEILEELIEELGYRAVDTIAATFPVPEFNPSKQPEPEEEGFVTGFDATEPMVDSRASTVSLEAFNQIISKGDSVSIPRLEALAGMLDVVNIRQGFQKAVELNHLGMAEVLLKRLPDEWVKFHLKQVVRRPEYMGLSKVVQFLPEHHLLFAMMEATNYGFLQAMGILNTFASEAIRDDVILQAAYRGRTEIVELLIPGRSQGALHLALNKAHHSGYWITRDLIFDHLNDEIIKSMVRPGIIKGRLIRALELDQMARVKQLVDLAPPEVRELLPVLLLRHSRERSKGSIAAYVASNASENPETFRHDIDELASIQRMAIGMTDYGREQLIDELIKVNKLPLLPVIFNRFTQGRKVTYLLELAERGEEHYLELLMKGADPVTRDQVLLESVRTMRPRSVIVELARHSDQPSIRRAAIYATKTGLPAEARILETYLPPEPPIYHLTEKQKALHKDELRLARNRQLGRRQLGDKYYIYLHQDKPARMLYVIAHGKELPRQNHFRHTGDYQLGFMAPDGHILATNHIEAFLEKRVVPKEIMVPGQWVKEYGLSKNYNSGWAFKRMHSDCGFQNIDLMERKAAPAVVSEVRKYFAETGSSIDLLMVRGKKEVYLSSLMQQLNRSKWANYRQVVVGCCRGVDDRSPKYILERPLTSNYVTYAPDLFMRVSNYLKVHPAFWDSPVWEYYHPDTAPEIWLNSLDNHQDQMVSYARKAFNYVAERAEKYSPKHQSTAARP